MAHWLGEPHVWVSTTAADACSQQKKDAAHTHAARVTGVGVHSRKTTRDDKKKREWVEREGQGAKLRCGVEGLGLARWVEVPREERRRNEKQKKGEREGGCVSTKKRRQRRQVALCTRVPLSMFVRLPSCLPFRYIYIYLPPLFLCTGGDAKEKLVRACGRVGGGRTV